MSKCQASSYCWYPRTGVVSLKNSLFDGVTKSKSSKPVLRSQNATQRNDTNVDTNRKADTKNRVEAGGREFGRQKLL